MPGREPIGEVIPFLHKHIHEIYTVAEWAHAAGYSRAHFSILIKKEFGVTPYTLIKREKYLKVKALVHQNPDRKGRIIAEEAGFKDVKALYKFLKPHYQTTLTAMRKKAKNNR